MSQIANLRDFMMRRQLTAVAIGIAVLGALMATIWLLGFHRPYVVLFSDLRPVDAATIVADLDKRKTPYRLDKGGTTILVPAKLVDATRLSVTSQDMPLKGVVGFELFNKSDMGLTEFAQRINYRRALEGELARTLMSLDAVDSARVHLALAEPVIFREERRASRASVTLIPRQGWTLSPDLIRGAQRLVAAATTDLDITDVVVLDQHGTVVSGAASAEAASSPPPVGERQAIETFYAARIRAVLEPLLTDNRVEVSVAAGPAGTAGAYEQWTPQTRTFPISTTLQLASPVGEAVRQSVLAAVAQAAGHAAAVDDNVIIVVAPGGAQATPVAAALPAATPVVAPPRFDWRSPRATALVAIALMLAALAAAAAWLHRRRDGERPLSVAQRQAFAVRLGVLLAKEAPDAAERL